MRNVRELPKQGNVSAVLVVAITPAAHAQSSTVSASDQKALSVFSHKTKAYIDKEHSLAADRMKPTSDFAKLEQQRHELRNAVQQSRANAKQGDLFTPEAGQAFRNILAKLFKGPDGAKIDPVRSTHRAAGVADTAQGIGISHCRKYAGAARHKR